MHLQPMRSSSSAADEKAAAEIAKQAENEAVAQRKADEKAAKETEREEAAEHKADKNAAKESSRSCTYQHAQIECKMLTTLIAARHYHLKSFYKNN